MIQKILNNIPNIENKKKENMRNLYQSNFHNLETMKNKNKLSLQDTLTNQKNKSLIKSMFDADINGSGALEYDEFLRLSTNDYSDINRKKTNKSLDEAELEDLTKKLSLESENFENNMASLYKTTLHSGSISMSGYNNKNDIDITEEEQTDGTRILSFLSAVSANEKPIPKKVPSVKGIDNGDVNVDNVDTKKYKLDWISSAYIGSISVIGLFIAYKAIKRTM